MRLDTWKSAQVLISFVLLTLFIIPPKLLAQTHVVGATDIHKELVDATQIRQRNREKVNQLFSSKDGQEALKSAKMNLTQVKVAVSTLNDAELARLASRADQAQNDFAAGRISDRDLLIIIVGIAALILIIVAVR